jgi:hypothetical protein
MHARVVRFTDVTGERISEIVSQVESDDGPPPGVDATGFELLFDEAQGTALFVGYFETEQPALSSRRWMRRTRQARGPRSTSARSRHSAHSPSTHQADRRPSSRRGVFCLFG